MQFGVTTIPTRDKMSPGRLRYEPVTSAWWPLAVVQSGQFAHGAHPFRGCRSIMARSFRLQNSLRRQTGNGERPPSRPVTFISHGQGG